MARAAPLRVTRAAAAAAAATAALQQPCDQRTPCTTRTANCMRQSRSSARGVLAFLASALLLLLSSSAPIHSPSHSLAPSSRSSSSSSSSSLLPGLLLAAAQAGNHNNPASDWQFQSTTSDLASKLVTRPALQGTAKVLRLDGTPTSGVDLTVASANDPGKAPFPTQLGSSFTVALWLNIERVHTPSPLPASVSSPTFPCCTTPSSVPSTQLLQRIYQYSADDFTTDGLTVSLSYSGIYIEALLGTNRAGLQVINADTPGLSTNGVPFVLAWQHRWVHLVVTVNASDTTLLGGPTTIQSWWNGMAGTPFDVNFRFLNDLTRSSMLGARSNAEAYQKINVAAPFVGYFARVSYYDVWLNETGVTMLYAQTPISITSSKIPFWMDPPPSSLPSTATSLTFRVWPQLDLFVGTVTLAISVNSSTGAVAAPDYLVFASPFDLSSQSFTVTGFSTATSLTVNFELPTALNSVNVRDKYATPAQVCIPILQNTTSALTLATEALSLASSHAEFLVAPSLVTLLSPGMIEFDGSASQWVGLDRLADTNTAALPAVTSAGLSFGLWQMMGANNGINVAQCLLSLEYSDGTTTTSIGVYDYGLQIYAVTLNGIGVPVRWGFLLNHAFGLYDGVTSPANQVGRWYHLVWVISDSTATMYIDGVARPSMPLARTLPTGVYSTTFSSDTTGSRLGACPSVLAFFSEVRPFAGRMAQFTYWNRQLTHQHVVALYQQPPMSLQTAATAWPYSPASSLVYPFPAITQSMVTAQWLFYEASTSANLASRWFPGRPSVVPTPGYLFFSSVSGVPYDDYLSLNTAADNPGSPAALATLPTLWSSANATFEFWFTHSDQANTAYLLRCNATSPTESFGILIDGATRRMRFYAQSVLAYQTGACNPPVAGGGAPCVFLRNRAMHVVVVFQGASARIIINGAVMSTVTLTGTLSAVPRDCRVGPHNDGDASLGMSATAANQGSGVAVFRISFFNSSLTNRQARMLTANPPVQLSPGPFLSLSTTTGTAGEPTPVTISTTLTPLFCSDAAILTNVGYSPNTAGGVSWCNPFSFNRDSNSLTCTIGADVPLNTPVTLALDIDAWLDAPSSAQSLAATFSVATTSASQFLKLAAPAVWNFSAPSQHAGWTKFGASSGYATFDGKTQYLDLASVSDNLPSGQTLSVFGGAPSSNLLPDSLQGDLILQLEADFGLVSPTRDALGQDEYVAANPGKTNKPGVYRGLIASWQDQSELGCGYHMSPPGAPYISLTEPSAASKVPSPHFAPSLVSSVAEDGLIDGIPYVDFAYGAQLLAKNPGERNSIGSCLTLPRLNQARVIFSVVRYKSAHVCNGWGTTTAATNMFCVGTEEFGRAAAGDLGTGPTSTLLPNAAWAPGAEPGFTKFGIHAVRVAPLGSSLDSSDPLSIGSGGVYHQTWNPDTDSVDRVILSPQSFTTVFDVTSSFVLNYFDPTVTPAAANTQGQQMAALFVFQALKSSEYEKVLAWIKLKYFGKGPKTKGGLPFADLCVSRFESMSGVRLDTASRPTHWLDRSCTNTSVPLINGPVLTTNSFGRPVMQFRNGLNSSRWQSSAFWRMASVPNNMPYKLGLRTLCVIARVPRVNPSPSVSTLLFGVGPVAPLTSANNGQFFGVRVNGGAGSGVGQSGKIGIYGYPGTSPIYDSYGFDVFEATAGGSPYYTHCLVLSVDSTGFTYYNDQYLNGVRVSSAQQVNFHSTMPSALYINSVTAGQGADVDISGILMWNRTLSFSEVFAASKYLEIKYTTQTSPGPNFNPANRGFSFTLTALIPFASCGARLIDASPCVRTNNLDNAPCMRDGLKIFFDCGLAGPSTLDDPVTKGMQNLDAIRIQILQDNSLTCDVSLTNPFVRNQWINLAFTFSPYTGITVYNNGAFYASFPCTKLPFLLPRRNNLLFGKETNSLINGAVGAVRPMFIGSLAQLVFFNRTLSRAETLLIASNPPAVASSGTFVLGATPASVHSQSPTVTFSITPTVALNQTVSLTLWPYLGVFVSTPTITWSAALGFGARNVTLTVGAKVANIKVNFTVSGDSRLTAPEGICIPVVTSIHELSVAKVLATAAALWTFSVGPSASNAPSIPAPSTALNSTVALLTGSSFVNLLSSADNRSPDGFGVLPSTLPANGWSFQLWLAFTAPFVSQGKILQMQASGQPLSLIALHQWVSPANLAKLGLYVLLKASNCGYVVAYPFEQNEFYNIVLLFDHDNRLRVYVNSILQYGVFQCDGPLPVVARDIALLGASTVLAGFDVMGVQVAHVAYFARPLSRIDIATLYFNPPRNVHRVFQAPFYSQALNVPEIFYLASTTSSTPAFTSSASAAAGCAFIGTQLATLEQLYSFQQMNPEGPSWPGVYGFVSDTEEVYAVSGVTLNPCSTPPCAPGSIYGALCYGPRPEFNDPLYFTLPFSTGGVVRYRLPALWNFNYPVHDARWTNFSTGTTTRAGYVSFDGQQFVDLENPAENGPFPDKNRRLSNLDTGLKGWTLVMWINISLANGAHLFDCNRGYPLQSIIIKHSMPTGITVEATTNVGGFLCSVTAPYALYPNQWTALAVRLGSDKILSVFVQGRRVADVLCPAFDAALGEERLFCFLGRSNPVVNANNLTGQIAFFGNYPFPLSNQEVLSTAINPPPPVYNGITSDVVIRSVSPPVIPFFPVNATRITFTGVFAPLCMPDFQVYYYPNYLGSTNSSLCASMEVVNTSMAFCNVGFDLPIGTPIRLGVIGTGTNTVNQSAYILVPGAAPEILSQLTTVWNFNASARFTNFVRSQTGIGGYVTMNGVDDQFVNLNNPLDNVGGLGTMTPFGSPATVVLTTSQTFSLHWWLRLNTFRVNARIFDCAQGSDGAHSFAVSFVPNKVASSSGVGVVGGMTLNIRLVSSLNTLLSFDLPSFPLVPQQWASISFTHDGYRNFFVYLNGNLVFESVLASAPLLIARDRCYIGKSTAGLFLDAPYTSPLDGAVAQFVFAPRTFSSHEVSHLNAALPIAVFPVAFSLSAVPYSLTQNNPSFSLTITPPYVSNISTTLLFTSNPGVILSAARVTWSNLTGYQPFELMITAGNADMLTQVFLNFTLLTKDPNLAAPAPLCIPIVVATDSRSGYVIMSKNSTAYWPMATFLANANAGTGVAPSYEPFKAVTTFDPLWGHHINLRQRADNTNGTGVLPAVLPVFGSTGFSLRIAVSFNQFDTPTSLIELSNGTSFADALAFRVLSAWRLQVTLYDRFESPSSVDFYLSTPLDAGTFYDLVLVYSHRATASVEVFLNGARVSNQIGRVMPLVAMVRTACYLGKSNAWGGSQYLNGSVGAMAFFTYPLPPATILTLALAVPSNVDYYVPTANIVTGSGSPLLPEVFWLGGPGFAPTFENRSAAQAACALFNTTLAYRGQLSQAFSGGADWECRCGRMEDGVQWVAQVNNVPSSCGPMPGATSTYDCPINSTSGAICWGIKPPLSSITSLGYSALGFTSNTGLTAASVYYHQSVSWPFASSGGSKAFTGSTFVDLVLASDNSAPVSPATLNTMPIIHGPASFGNKDGGFSLFLWLQVFQSTAMSIFDCASSTSATDNNVQLVQTAQGKLAFNVYSSVLECTAIVDATLTPYTWANIGVVMDARNRIRVYVWGRLMLTQKCAGGPLSMTMSAATAPRPTCFLGKSATSSNSFVGSMSTFTFVHRPLQAGEVMRLASRAPPAVVPPIAVTPSWASFGTERVVTFTNIWAGCGMSDGGNTSVLIRYQPNFLYGNSFCTPMVYINATAVRCTIAADIALNQTVYFSFSNGDGIWTNLSQAVNFTAVGTVTDLSNAAQARWNFSLPITDPLIAGPSWLPGPTLAAYTGLADFINTDPSINAGLHMDEPSHNPSGVPGRNVMPTLMGSAAKGGFSFETWVLLQDSFPNGKPILSFLSSASTPANSIVISSTNGLVSMQLYTNFGTVQCTLSMTRGFLNDVAWAHLVLTYDASNWMRGYMDGQLVGGPTLCTLNSGTGYALVSRPIALMMGYTALTVLNLPLLGQAARLHYFARAITDVEVSALFRDVPPSLGAFFLYSSVTFPDRSSFALLDQSSMPVNSRHIIRVQPVSIFNNNPSITLNIRPDVGTATPSTLVWFHFQKSQEFAYNAPAPPAFNATLNLTVETNSRGYTSQPRLFFQLTFRGYFTWNVAPARIYPTEYAMIQTNLSAFFGWNVSARMSAQNTRLANALLYDVPAAGSFVPATRVYDGDLLPTSAWSEQLLQSYLFQPNLATYQAITEPQNISFALTQFAGDIYLGHYATLYNSVNVSYGNQNVTILPFETFQFTPPLLQINNTFICISDTLTLLVSPVQIPYEFVSLTISVTLGTLFSPNVSGVHWWYPLGSDASILTFHWNATTTGSANFTLVYTAPPQSAVVEDVKQRLRWHFTYTGDNAHRNISDVLMSVNDVKTFSISYGDTGLRGLVPSPIPVSPPFRMNTYSYVQSGSQRVSVGTINIYAVFGTPESVTAFISGYSRVLVSGEFAQLPLEQGLARLVIQSNLSGNYSIMLDRTTLEPNLRNLSLKLSLNTPFYPTFFANSPANIPYQPFPSLPSPALIVEDYRSFLYTPLSEAPFWNATLQSDFRWGVPTYYADVAYVYANLNVSVSFISPGTVFISARNDWTAPITTMTVGTGAFYPQLSGINAPAWSNQTYLGGGYSFRGSSVYYASLSSPGASSLGYGVAFPLFCGNNFIDVVDLIDGNYTVVVNRTMGDVTDIVLLDATVGTAGGRIGAPQTLTPSFASCNGSFTVNVPYYVIQVVWVITFRTPDTVVLDRYQSPILLSNAIATNTSTDPTLLLQGNNPFNVNSKLDGIYSFNVVRGPPDIKYIAFRAWWNALMPPFNFSLSTVPSWSSGATSITYQATVGWIVDALEVFVTYGIPQTVEIDVNNYAFTYRPKNSSGYGDSGTLHKPLPVGVNLLRVNSTYDGVYSFQITRKNPELSLTVLTHTTFLAQPFDSSAIPAGSVMELQNAYRQVRNVTDRLMPAYVPNTPVFNYALTLNYSAFNLSFYPVFATAATVRVEVAVEIGGGLTSLMQTIPASAFLSRVRSKPVALVVGVTWFTFYSSMDGTYRLKVTRLPMDLQSITVLSGINARAFAEEFPSVSVMQPQSTFSVHVRDYALTVPYIVTSLRVIARFAMPRAVVVEMNGLPQSAYYATNGALEPPPTLGSSRLLDPLHPFQRLTTNLSLVSVGSNVLVVSDENDGSFLFSVFRSPPDVQFLQITGFSTDGTQRPISIDPPFTAQVMSYSAFVVPQVTLVDIELQFNTPGTIWLLNATQGLRRYQANGGGSGWSDSKSSIVPIPGFSTPLVAGPTAVYHLPIVPGPNLFYFNSSRDGLYALLILQNSASIAGVTLATSYSSYEPVTFPDRYVSPVSLYPQYLGGLLGPYAVTSQQLIAPAVVPDGWGTTTLGFVHEWLYLTLDYDNSSLHAVPQFNASDLMVADNFAILIGTTATSVGDSPSLMTGFNTSLYPISRSQPFHLGTGVNSFQLSTRDGVYVFSVTRALPSVGSLRMWLFDRSGNRFPIHSLLTPPFAVRRRHPEYSFAYNCSFEMAYVAFAVNYTTSRNRISMFHTTAPQWDDDRLVNASLNAQLYANEGMNSSEIFPSASFFEARGLPNQLPYGSHGYLLQPGQNSFVVSSALDGAWVFDVWQGANDVRNLSVSHAGFDFVHTFPTVNVSSFDATAPGPWFNKDTLGQHFRVSLPWATTEASVAVTFLTGGTVRLYNRFTYSYVCNSDVYVDAAPGRMTNVGIATVRSNFYSCPITLPPGTTVMIDVMSLSDGNYTIDLVRAPADISRLVVYANSGADFQTSAVQSPETGLQGVDYTTQINGVQVLISNNLLNLTTFNEVAAPITVPHYLHTLSFFIRVMVSSNSTAVVWSEAWGTTTLIVPNATLSRTDPGLPLAVGVNLLNVSTPLSGTFRLNITRLPPDIFFAEVDAWRTIPALETNTAGFVWSAVAGNTAGNTKEYVQSMAVVTAAVNMSSLRSFHSLNNYYVVHLSYRWTSVGFRMATLSGTNITSDMDGLAGSSLRMPSGAVDTYPAGYPDVLNPTGQLVAGSAYKFHLVSKRDGNYTFTIVRNQPDAARIVIVGNNYPGTDPDTDVLTFYPSARVAGDMYYVNFTAMYDTLKFRIDGGVPTLVHKVECYEVTVLGTNPVQPDTLAVPAYFSATTASPGFLMPQRATFLCRLVSPEDGEFYFSIYHTQAYFAPVEFPALSTRIFPHTLYANQNSGAVVLRPLGVPSPTVRMQVQIPSLATRGGVLRYFNNEFRGTVVEITSSPTGGSGAYFPTDATAQSFDFTPPTTYEEYTTTVSYFLSGLDYLSFDPTSGLSHPLRVLPQQNFTGITNSSFVYSTQSWSQRFAWTEGVNAGFNVTVTATVSCVALPFATVPAVTVGGSCGVPVEAYFFSHDYASAGVPLQAPEVLLANQLFIATFSLSGGDAPHYRVPPPMKWTVLPQATLVLNQMPVNMSGGQTATVLVTASQSPIGTGFTFVATVTNQAGVVIRTQQVPFTSTGALTQSFFFTAPALADVLSVSFSSTGEDAWHFALPLTVNIPVGKQAVLVTSAIPKTALSGIPFTFTVMLSQRPFGSGSVQVKASVSGGATITPELISFDFVTWDIPQLFTVTPPIVQYGREAKRPAERQLLFEQAVAQDTILVITLLIIGQNQYQYVPITNTTVSLLSVMELSTFPSFLYVNSISAPVQVNWHGTEFAHVQVTVQVLQPAGSNALVSPSSIEYTGTLTPWSFAVHAPTSLPSNSPPSVVVRWSLSGADAARFDILPVRNITIPIVPQASFSLGSIPTLMYTGQSTPAVRMLLSSPVTVGSGGLDVFITVTAVAGGIASSDPTLAGFTSPVSVHFDEGAAESSFTYTAPAIASIANIAFTFGGGDAAHYALSPPTLAPIILVNTLFSFIIGATPAQVNSNSEYLLLMRPAGPPEVGTSVAIEIYVSGGSVSPTVLFYGASNYTLSQAVIIRSPVLPDAVPGFPAPSATQTVTFAVVGSGAAAFAGAIAPRNVFVVPGPSTTIPVSSSTGASSSSTGDNGAAVLTSSSGIFLAEESSSGFKAFTESLPFPFWLFIVILAIGLLSCCLVIFIVLFYFRRTETQKRLLELQAKEAAAAAKSPIAVPKYQQGDDAASSSKKGEEKESPKGSLKGSALPAPARPSLVKAGAGPPSARSSVSLLASSRGASALRPSPSGTPPARHSPETSQTILDVRGTPKKPASAALGSEDVEIVVPKDPGPLLTEVPQYYAHLVVQSTKKASPPSSPAASPSAAPSSSSVAIHVPTRPGLMSGHVPPSSPSVAPSPSATSPNARGSGTGAAKSRSQLRTFLYGSMLDSASSWTTAASPAAGSGEQKQG